MNPRSRTAPAALLLIAAVGLAAPAVSFAQPKFALSFPEELSKTPLDGRLLLLISTNDEAEPRLQIGDGPRTGLVFGIDVEGLAPGEEAIIDDSAFGYPLRSLAELPTGEYCVQALLHRYETFHRSDGHAVKLPMDRGEGQHWNAAPGNLLSAPLRGPHRSRRCGIDPNRPRPGDPAHPRLPETKYIRHERIQSERLTRFWGRPMYLGAHVLVPEGFDEHPEARYPLIINHGHFPYTFEGFRETPPDPDLKPDFSERFRLDGYNRIEQEYAYQFYKDWIGQGRRAF